MPAATDTIDRQVQKNRQCRRLRLAAAGICLAAAVLAVPAPAWAESADSKLVVVLYPEPNDGSPGSALADRGLRAALAGVADGNVEIHNEYVDVSRNSPRDHEEEFVRHLRRKYARRKVDLLVTGLSPTLNFTLEHRDKIFPGVPVVFMAVDRQEVESRQLPADVIGVPVTMDLGSSLAAALLLLPETERVVVVAGSSKFDAFWEAKARSTFPPAGHQVDVEYLVGLPLNELLTAVEQLPEHSLIYYLHVMEDRDGRMHMPAMVLERMAARANAPVFGHVDSYLGRGIVGGRVFSFEKAGRDAGELGARILAGEDPAAIGIQPPADSSYIFDSRQLGRWGIRTASLPSGSEIRHREPTLWDQYKWHVASLFILCTMQAMLIAGLLVQRNRRAQAEKELRKSREELQRLAGQILGAQEAERRRIARELHDDLGQDLALLSVELDLYRQQTSANGADSDPRIQAMSAHVKQLSSSVHNLSHQLHPMKLEQLGLVAALRGLCKELSEDPKLWVEFNHEGVPGTIPHEAALCLYRIAQEALRNVVKHSDAAQARVTLTGGEGSLRLEIRDAGRGFDPVDVAGRGGLGLVSMQERLRLVGGQLKIDSRRGSGTGVVARVPLGVGTSASVELKPHAAHN